MTHDYINPKYDKENRPRFVSKTPFGNFGGTDWTPAPRDYAERELLQERLNDEEPRGGPIHISEESERAWHEECEARTGDKDKRQRAYQLSRAQKRRYSQHTEED